MRGLEESKAKNNKTNELYLWFAPFEKQPSELYEGSKGIDTRYILENSL